MFIKLTKEDKPSQLSLFSTEHSLTSSITRSVTKMLMSSIVRLKRAIESGDTDEGKAMISKETLSASDIHLALKAFDDGKNVRITGTLRILSRQRIIESSSFQIIE